MKQFPFQDFSVLAVAYEVNLDFYWCKRDQNQPLYFFLNNKSVSVR